MLKLLIVRWIARNLDSLLDFLNDLDTQLETYVSAQEAKEKAIDDEVSRLAKEKEAVTATKATATNLRSGIKNVVSG